MQAITEPEILIRHNPDDYGWEVPGEFNEMTRSDGMKDPMTKYNNRYYLQYSAPDRI